MELRINSFAGLSVRQGGWIECLTGKLDGLIDRNPRLRVGRDAELCAWEGCLICC